MLNRGSMLVVGLLILILVITSWYAASMTRIASIMQGGGLINMGVLTGTHVIQTTDQGALLYEGTMQSATEFNNGDIHFVALNVNFYNGQVNLPPWQLSADTGSVMENNQQIDLDGHVLLSRKAATGIFPVVVATDHAAIYPNTERITGTGLITFTQPGTINKMSGIGFVADIQAKWIKLLSNVQGIYAPR